VCGEPRVNAVEILLDVFAELVDATIGLITRIKPCCYNRIGRYTEQRWT
jgi:hypothetical protein